MEQAVRNKLRNVVTQCRKLLEESISQQLQGQFGIYAGKKDAVQVEDEARMGHLSEEDRQYRRDLLDHFEHIKARGFKPREALDQLVREIAFTHLNRLCAYKMMEARDVYVGGQKFREAVSRGIDSNGFKFYLADHPDQERLFKTGEQELAYRHFLDWLGGLLSEEIGVLFNPNDPANRLYPRQKTLDQVVGLLNGHDIKPEEKELQEAWLEIWKQDETIGWVYQYFTPNELRDQARKESAAPRNSYELAFRNQFFTPRYVVEFLTDNTLGRIWHEMRRGDTKLKVQCRYMVRRPNELFLDEGQEPPREAAESHDDLSQEKLFKQPVYLPYRPKKDPRELKILDPACGSGHFLLYCFDLLLTIYEEAYEDEDLGPALKEVYPTLDELRRAVPGLIVSRNLHGIDIDLRATQIAALALWLRSQRAYQDLGIKKDRPKITRSNIVCAEPMPGEEGLFDEFLNTLREERLEQLIRRVMDAPADKPVRATEDMADRLCELVRLVWEKMKLAGEVGSLLKIEEELQDAIRQGQEEWEENQPLFRISQYSLTEERQEKFIRFVSGEGVSFWERAEALVMAALNDFAAYASNGHKLLRKLFVNDAMQGFAFVDVCRQRFDVVLMNPPYGDSPAAVKPYLRTRYKGQPNDAYACFIERFSERVDGALGALTSHTFLNYSSFASLRQEVLIPRVSVRTAADFGLGVLDAMVRTVAFTLEPLPVHRSVFFRLLETNDKQAALERLLDSLHAAKHDPHIYMANQSLFSSIPNSPFAYWLPKSLIDRFATSHTFSEATDSRLGLQTANNDRYLRVWTEVDSSDIGADGWAFYSKGGDFLKYDRPIELVVDWRGNGRHIQEAYGKAVRLRDPDQYFKMGATYPLVNEYGMNAAALPANCVFDNTCPSVFPRKHLSHASLLALLNSRVVQMLFRCQTSTRHWQVGYLRTIPCPNLDSNIDRHLAAKVEEACNVQRSLLDDNELCVDFVRPHVCVQVHDDSSFTEALKRTILDRDIAILRLVEIDYTLEEAINNAYGLTEKEIAALDIGIGAHPYKRVRHNDSGGSDSATSDPLENEGGQSVESYYRITLTPLEQLSASRGITPAMAHEVRTTSEDILSDEMRNCCSSLPAYCLGCCFGRWDVRIGADPTLVPRRRGTFDSLPRCSPGMLQDSRGYPATRTPDDYPLRVDWDGIMVDDPEHPDDIVQRIRETLEILWPERSDEIEKEMDSILGVKRFRDYLRRSGTGGFWDDHVKRYSSRPRRAPIYWLLQSSKKNYALWLYYHRLDKDMLFKALVNYVEPKIQREENRLAELRSQKSSAGESGKGAKKLDRDIEKQEDLLSELRDFAERLQKVANLHIVPDLNDGVVLNIAPLWELVPWKEAKKYWEELLDGKYEWSSIGKQLREMGLVKVG